MGSSPAMVAHIDNATLTPTQIGRLLVEAGFSIVNAWGDFEGDPLTDIAKYQVYLAQACS